MLSRKKMSSLKLTIFVKKKFQIIKIDKNKSQNLAKTKNVKSFCCSDLRYVFSIFLFLRGSVS